MSTIIPASARFIDCEQGSGDWLQMRLGMVTSSRIAAVVNKRKRTTKPRAGDPVSETPPALEELAARRDMRYELVSEILTGKASEHFVSRWMKEGKEKEPLARAEFELSQDMSTSQIGFVYHPFIPRAGCSPDSLIGEDQIVEFKCPTLFTHMEYIIKDEVPEEYQPQLLWQMACCERPIAWFVSYHPDLPEPHQLFIKKFEATKERLALIRGYELEVVHFLEEVDQLVKKFKR